MKRKVKYGLAFSGGGARGIAHLGVLQALEENNIRPVVVSGTSMGAMVAVSYALGIPSRETLEFIKEEVRPMAITNMDLNRMGIFNLNKVEKFLRERVEKDDFSALKIPVYITVTNLNTGKFEIRSEGKLIEYVMASASIPLLFNPMVIDGTYYVDGGVTKNLSAEILKGKCDKIIGIHVNHIAQLSDFRRMKDVAVRTYHLAINNTIAEEKRFCDYFIDPPATRNFSTLDFDKADEIYDLGYKEGLKLAKKLLADEASEKRFWKMLFGR
ncbi:MAG: patatin-like phospholipase family protein [Bacteroidales bacterium]|nr:patatin-like phospholipase family protein [Bacteroidales bacterium]